MVFVSCMFCGTHHYLFNSYVTVLTTILPNLQLFVYHNIDLYVQLYCFYFRVYINHMQLTKT